MPPMVVKGVLAVLWCGAVLLLALGWQAPSGWSWLSLMAIAVPPPALLFYFWRDPLPSTSARIRAAR